MILTSSTIRVRFPGSFFLEGSKKIFFSFPNLKTMDIVLTAHFVFYSKAPVYQPLANGLGPLI